MMRRRATAIGLFVLLGVAVVAVLVTRELGYRPDLGTGASLLFKISSGESFGRVTDRMFERGWVRYPTVLKGYAWMRRYDRRIKAGTYRLMPGERVGDMLTKFVEGDIYRVSVTIPEGFMHRQIAGVVAAELMIDSTAFYDLTNDEALRERLGVEGPTLEGYLFPDTYLIPWGSSPEAVVATMVKRLDEVFDTEFRRRAAEIGMSRREVLTLASIVQAETRLPKELGLVSAVYHNRLERGMRLEADPTVAYAKGGYIGRLFYRDLEIDSPYNTYRNYGLPPGPICNPGEAAIGAALYPDSTFQALYFVAEGDGGHIFSETLSEHLAAVKKVRQNRSK